MSKDKNIGKFIDNFFDVSKEIIIIPLENNHPLILRKPLMQLIIWIIIFQKIKYY